LNNTTGWIPAFAGMASQFGFLLHIDAIHSRCARYVGKNISSKSF
jgi:hypothetical protein